QRLQVHAHPDHEGSGQAREGRPERPPRRAPALGRERRRDAARRRQEAGGDEVVNREIPLYTLEGVQDAEVTTHHFSTADGLGLSLLRFNRDPGNQARDSVMIVHGLTTSTDMFIMPEHDNLVSYLLDNGYTDVWCL